MKRKLPFVAFGRSLSGGDHPWLDLDFEGVAEKRSTGLAARAIAISRSRPRKRRVNYGYVFVDAYRRAMTSDMASPLIPRIDFPQKS